MSDFPLSDFPVSDFALGRIGLWTRSLDRLPMAVAQESAAELEQLGYRTLWVPEVIGREPLVHAALLLAGTSELIVGAGVANIYARSAMTMQSAWKTLTEAFPERFVLGLGVSQAEIVEGLHQQIYGKPYRKMVDYLDEMERATFVGVKPTTPQRLVLAALRPRLLRLAAERSMGAMSYFVPVEHTAWARDILGTESLLLISQAVVIEPDPSNAREIARRYMATYLALPTYADRLRELGWTEDDLAGPTDALVDAVVAWGSPANVALRLREHLDAGADHVAAQVITADHRAVPLTEWRELAEAVREI